MVKLINKKFTNLEEKKGGQKNKITHIADLLRQNSVLSILGGCSGSLLMETSSSSSSSTVTGSSTEDPASFGRLGTLLVEDDCAATTGDCVLLTLERHMTKLI